MNYASLLRRADRHQPARSISSCAVRVRRGPNGRAMGVRPVSQAGLGFSLKPSKRIRRLAKAIKRQVTLKRVLAAGAIVGGGLLARKAVMLGRKALLARRLRRAGGAAGGAAVPGIPISQPMSEPVNYAATPAPEFSPPVSVSRGEGEAEPAPVQAGAGRGPAMPLIIGGLILATLVLPKILRKRGA